MPLLVVGALATPVTGLLIRPDVYGARHGNEMFTILGQFVWYGYIAATVAVLATALVGIRRGTPLGRLRAAGTVNDLLALMVLFGSVHVLVVTTGLNHGEGQPWLAAVAAAIGVAGASALVTARTRLRR